MGRNNKNARSRPHGRRIHVNKYIGKIGRTKTKNKGRMKAGFGSYGVIRDQEKTCSQERPHSQERPSTQEKLNTRPWITGPIPRRYEIWFAELGDHYGTSVQSGNRPVLVISNDVGNQYSQTLTVIPMTTKLKKMEMPSHTVITGDDCCLFRPEILQDSILLAEQITTIDKSALRNRLCRVTSRDKQKEIEQSVAAQLDMLDKCEGDIGADTQSNIQKAEED